MLFNLLWYFQMPWQAQWCCMLHLSYYHSILIFSQPFSTCILHSVIYSLEEHWDDYYSKHGWFTYSNMIGVLLIYFPQQFDYVSLIAAISILDRSELANKARSEPVLITKAICSSVSSSSHFTHVYTQAYILHGGPPGLTRAYFIVVMEMLINKNRNFLLKQ